MPAFLIIFSSGMTMVFPMHSLMVRACALRRAPPWCSFPPSVLAWPIRQSPPFSTGGVLYLSAYHNEKLSTRLVGQLLGSAFCSMAYGAIVATLIGLIL